MQTISLTQNQITTVSDEDFEYLNQFKWFAHKYKSSSGVEKFYTERTARDPITRKEFIVYLHHEVMGRINEEEYQQKISQGLEIDHKNRNRLDNQRSNLRWVTRQQNSWNRSLRSDNISGFKGVNLDRVKTKYKNKTYEYEYWRARIDFDSKEIRIGSFKSKEEAALAYDQKAKELFGEFACLNFSD